MSYRIQVPIHSPAYDSYLGDGWRQVRVDGRWAVLQMEGLEVSTFPDVGGEQPDQSEAPQPAGDPWAYPLVV